jgi:D-alanyl-D-alanine carboxypeptidase (penicillin-binding protein 5/6)
MKPKLYKLAVAVVILLIVAEAINFSRPLPAVTAQTLPLSYAPAATSLSWPAAGQAAIGTRIDGVLETHGDQKPVSIASIAKVIAALAVLKEKPLAAGEQGPTITLGQQDVDLLNYYYSNDGSIARVVAGERISEYQALQAMMLPSANNMADSLTRWAFGSDQAYAAYANQMVQTMGLENTSVTGASGFADDTLSTASDLVRLGQAVLNNPVLSDIVSQSTAVIPAAGTIHNVNWLLGEDGVVGIKTGNTDKAGGCFLFAAKRQMQGQTVDIIGAVLGDTTLNKAISDSRQLIQSSNNNFRLVRINAGQIVGRYSTAWGVRVDAVIRRDINLVAWNSLPVRIKTTLKDAAAGAGAGTETGQTLASAGGQAVGSPIVLKSSIDPPAFSWRLTRF